tara:strand:- start:515 stop:1447 length:933 start_codon:yes stop_codon:yes gene_type:complete
MFKTKKTLPIIIGMFFCVLYFYASVFKSESHWVRLFFAQDLSASNTPPASKSTRTVIRDMVLIPPGEFIMGSDPEIGYDMCKENKYDLQINNSPCDKNWYLREAPAHKVFLDAFYIDKYEVTQEKYKTVSGKNPSEFKGFNHPVENINWSEANQYCKSIGKRLPTEAEWEKAAKGGSETIFAWGNKMESGKANYTKGYFPASEENDITEGLGDGYKFTAPVGTYPPNGFGLFDMSGNVMEWVQDWIEHNYYAFSPRKNPKGPRTGRKKGLRGGSYHDLPVHIRLAWRDGYNPTGRYNSFGFRCAFSAPKK